MRISGPNIYLALLAMVPGFTAGHAQALNGGSSAFAAQPVQPVVAPLFTGDAKSPNSSSDTQASDQRALTGAQDLSPDLSEPRRSYWQPFFNLTSALDTNPLGMGSALNVAPWASFYGGANLHLSSHVSDFNANYLGGGVVSRYSNEDAPIQHLDLSERLSWRHVVVSLFDQAAYFPEAVSEFYLPTGSDPFGNRDLSLQPVFLPNQSISSTVGQEVSNSFVGELDLITSQRSSFTFLESFSVVRFFDADLLDLDDTVLQAGWNHQLTRNNTVAVLYRLDAFRFSNVYQPLDGHVVQLEFGRQVTGHLAFQLSAGPELGLFRSLGPVTSASAPPIINESRQIYWTADSSVTYQAGRTLLRLGYDHGLTDGAGYLAGAVTDQASGSIDGQLSRTVTGEIIAGYARNRALIEVMQTPTHETYQDWFAGVTIHHSLSRRASIFFSYQMQRQGTNFSCAGLGCGSNFTRHVVSVGFTGRAQAHPIG